MSEKPEATRGHFGPSGVPLSSGGKGAGALALKGSAARGGA